MRYLIVLLLTSISSVMQAAEEPLIFKKEVASSVSWMPYGLVFIILLITVFILAKNSRIRVNTQSKCKILEKINIHHKTKIYIMDYDGQQFIIADNQTALAIQPLQGNG